MALAAAVSSPPRDRLAAFAALKDRLDARSAAGRQASHEGRIASGIPAFDAALGGGLLPGSIATLEGAPGTGRMAVAARWLAAATARGLAAVIDDGTLFPPALARAGVHLDRLLVVSVDGSAAIARAVDIVLRSRAFGIVLMPAVALRAQVWSRLAGLAHKAGAVLLALGEPGTALAAFAATRIGCVLDRVRVVGSGGVHRRFAGYDLHARILKQRGIAPGACAQLQAFD